MRRVLQGAALTGVLAIGAMFGPGATAARAQAVVPYPGYPGGYVVGRVVPTYPAGVVTYPGPVVVNRGYAGYRGYGYGGYGPYGPGYRYPRHRHHRFYGYRY